MSFFLTNSHVIHDKYLHLCGDDQYQGAIKCIMSVKALH